MRETKTYRCWWWNGVKVQEDVSEIQVTCQSCLVQWCNPLKKKKEKKRKEEDKRRNIMRSRVQRGKKKEKKTKLTSLSFEFTLAPMPRRNAANVTWFFLAAYCSGVTPSFSKATHKIPTNRCHNQLENRKTTKIEQKSYSRHIHSDLQEKMNGKETESYALRRC